MATILAPRRTVLPVRLHVLHPAQRAFVASPAKRKVLVAGRRGGKTVAAGDLAVRAAMRGARVLEAAPTADQTTAFWDVVCDILRAPIQAGAVYKNETDRLLRLPEALGGGRIRAKTAWDADTLRGDYADLLILDEYALMKPETWDAVGQPMLLDNGGDAAFLSTPRRAKHFQALWAQAQGDTSGRWAAFHFTSHDNPYLDREALADLERDMTRSTYRQEILAEFLDEVPGALWGREALDALRVREAPRLHRIVVAIDPSASSTGDAAGIVVAGLGADGHGYVLDDLSMQGSPYAWASKAVTAYHAHRADRVVAEVNNGGEMVALTLRTVDENVAYRPVHASRGKRTRAEPVAALYERGRVHHVGVLADLEEEMCTWTPEEAASPNRMDALVWALTDLMLAHSAWVRGPAT